MCWCILIYEYALKTNKKFNAAAAAAAAVCASNDGKWWKKRMRNEKKIALNFNGTGNKRVVSGYCCAENGVAQKVFCTIDNRGAHCWDGCVGESTKMHSLLIIS